MSFRHDAAAAKSWPSRREALMRAIAAHRTVLPEGIYAAAPTRQVTSKFYRSLSLSPIEYTADRRH